MNNCWVNYSSYDMNITQLTLISFLSVCGGLSSMRSLSTPLKVSAPWGKSTPCSPTPTSDPWALHERPGECSETQEWRSAWKRWEHRVWCRSPLMYRLVQSEQEETWTRVLPEWWRHYTESQMAVLSEQLRCKDLWIWSHWINLTYLKESTTSYLIVIIIWLTFI